MKRFYHGVEYSISFNNSLKFLIDQLQHRLMVVLTSVIPGAVNMQKLTTIPVVNYSLNCNRTMAFLNAPSNHQNNFVPYMQDVK